MDLSSLTRATVARRKPDIELGAEPRISAANRRDRAPPYIA